MTNVCFSQGLSSALEVVKNISQQKDITFIQERNYQMALSLLILVRRVFDIQSKKESLKIVSEWHVTDDEILNFYLAERSDGKHYLYARYIGFKSDIGIYIKDNEVDKITSLNKLEILEHWKRLFK